MINRELALTLNRASKFLWDKKLKMLSLDELDSKKDGNVIACFPDDLSTAIDIAIQNGLKVPFLVFYFQRNDLALQSLSGVKYVSIPIKIGRIIKEFKDAIEEIRYTEENHKYSYLRYLSRMKKQAASHK